MLDKNTGIRISMDGRGRWMDNVFIERLWRSLKYECVFLNAFETGSEARAGIGDRSLNRLLQRRSFPLGPRRQDPRRSLCYRHDAGEIGGVIETRIHLSQVAKLSRNPGPPLLSSGLLAQTHTALGGRSAQRRPRRRACRGALNPHSPDDALSCACLRRFRHEEQDLIGYQGI
jgi:Integrase core domain